PRLAVENRDLPRAVDDACPIAANQRVGEGRPRLLVDDDDVVPASRPGPVRAVVVREAREGDDLPAGVELEANVVRQPSAEAGLVPEQPVGVAIAGEDPRTVARTGDGGQRLARPLALE